MVHYGIFRASEQMHIHLNKWMNFKNFISGQNNNMSLYMFVPCVCTHAITHPLAVLTHIEGAATLCHTPQIYELLNWRFNQPHHPPHTLAYAILIFIYYYYFSFISVESVVAGLTSQWYPDTHYNYRLMWKTKRKTDFVTPKNHRRPPF